MSDTTQPRVSPEPAASASTSGRPTALIAAVTVATLAVLAGGAYAAMSLLGGSDGAEKALPATTVAELSVDLDPGAKQKIEAIRTLRKFPEFRKEAKVDSGDDLREKLFDETLHKGTCKGKVTYAHDIEPWIGKSAALGAIPAGSAKLAPVLALAVSDQDTASKGLTALLACSREKGDEAGGFAFDDDGFVLISDTTAHAKKAVADAKDKALVDDAAYQTWTDRAGDRGVLNFYVAKAAAAYATKDAGALSSLGGLGGLGALGGSASASDDAARKALKNFTGAAGALRFADGGMELAAVGGGLTSAASTSTAGAIVRDLPKDTTAALAVSVPKGFAARLVSGLKSLDIPLLGSGSALTDQARQLGITLPDDLSDLLGQGLAVSVSGTPPSDLSQLSGPDDVPAGLTIKGDPDRIVAVIDKITAAIGASSNDVTVKKGEGKVTIAFDSRYAADLAKSGDLSTSSTFSTVVPDSDKASALLYVDVNSTWRAAIAKVLSGSEKAEFLANTEPLKAVGFSTWREDDQTHVLLKVTTD